MKKYASNSLQKISSYNTISDKRTSDKQRSKNNLRNSLDFFLTHRDKKGFLRSSEGFQIRLVLRQLISFCRFSCLRWNRTSPGTEAARSRLIRRDQNIGKLRGSGDGHWCWGKRERERERERGGGQIEGERKVSMMWMIACYALKWREVERRKYDRERERENKNKTKDCGTLKYFFI